MHMCIIEIFISASFRTLGLFLLTWNPWSWTGLSIIYVWIINRGIIFSILMFMHYSVNRWCYRREISDSGSAVSDEAQVWLRWAWGWSFRTGVWKRSSVFHDVEMSENVVESFRCSALKVWTVWRLLVTSSFPQTQPSSGRSTFFSL